MPNISSDELILILPPELNRAWVSNHLLPTLQRGKIVILDCSATTMADSAGYAYLSLLNKQCKTIGAKLILRQLAPMLLTSLNRWAPDIDTGAHDKASTSFFSSIGAGTILFIETVQSALSVFTEMFYWSTIGLIKKRDFKQGAIAEQMYQLGFKALGIVGLLSLLIGIVLALQTAMQLQAYGAGIFLAPMIGVSMVRELGPLLTAIILAGRSGSATTAEIATMGVGEELDALRTMGINPIQYVVTPKFWAITVTMPILTFVAAFAGIFGGFLVAVFFLDLAPMLFFNELLKWIRNKDVIMCLIKSIAFAWLIIGIGSFYGFRVRGGAEAVGRETTASVVTGIFVIILADAVFSFIFKL